MNFYTTITCIYSILFTSFFNINAQNKSKTELLKESPSKLEIVDVNNSEEQVEAIGFKKDLSSKVELEAEQQPESDLAKWEIFVRDTHEISLRHRKSLLKAVVSKNDCWPYEKWGETMWCLASLYMNENVEEANKRLHDRALKFLNESGDTMADFNVNPDGITVKKLPWAYFASPDYLRILYFFSESSRHYPGRLNPNTERVMLESLWFWMKQKVKYKDFELNKLMVSLTTENHDYLKRSSYYLSSYLFMIHPEFKDRLYDDGTTVSTQYEQLNRYYKNWPRKRASNGMWIEVGSDTYQKYSWICLVNLAEISPDPIVRKGFKLLFDLALIEEAQISINGRRGGGRSRAGYGKNNFEGYKGILYGKGKGSHSKVFETSSLQAPAEAILLRFKEFPISEAFTIENRVLGELFKDDDNAHPQFKEDSALINYVYRTPNYMLGSTQQKPSLNMPRLETGKPMRKYHGISNQFRMCGILFELEHGRFGIRKGKSGGSDDEVCAVYPKIQRIVPDRGGRPQHPYWSYQHKNLLFLQRVLGDKSGVGSYNTGKISIHFYGKKLKKVEKGGWIFASKGEGYVAVKFLDDEYIWDEKSELASPSNYSFKRADRYFMVSGDNISDGSFEEFQKNILSNDRLIVKDDYFAYESHFDDTLIECYSYDPAKFDQFQMPKLNTKTIGLSTEWTYKSPYINSAFQNPQIHVTVGPIRNVYDFGKYESSR